jgi:predicted transcriptional regulator
VQRNVEALVNHGWVENSNRTYSINACGEAVTAEFLKMVKTTQVANRLQPFLKWVDRSAFDIELRYLSDAELLLPEPNNPYAMVDRHVQLIKQSESHRVVLPLVGLHGFEAGHEQIVSGNARAEFIVGPETADMLRSDPPFSDLTQEMLDTGRFKIRVYHGEIPYFVGILDDTVQIGVDENGEPRALLEAESPDVLSWAEAKYDSYKEDAEVVAP